MVDTLRRGPGVGVTLDRVAKRPTAPQEEAGAAATFVAADIGSLSPWALAAGATVIYMVLNAVLFAVTRARFTRPKLIRPRG